MWKIIRVILILGVLTFGLSYIFNPYQDIRSENGKEIATKVVKSYDIDLNEFLSKYNAREFNEVEIIGDEKLVGKKEISTTFLIKSATLGGDIYEKKIETYVSHKPKTTPITDLGIKPDTGSGAMKLVINNQETGIVSKLLLDILPSIAIFVLFIFLLTKFGPKGGMPFGIKIGSLNKKDGASAPKTTFVDVAGMEEVKQELAEIVDFLKNPEKYRAVGARIPKGVLLYGAPGGGKTLLARAVAGEANVPFYSASGSEFMEMLVGMGAAKVRELFGKAKLTSPSIVFIDEIDAIGKKRGSGHTGGHQEQEQTLNQILTEMDGFEQGTNVIVIAATNRPDTLDPALLRSGRFDRKVLVGNPNFEERLEIIRYYLKNKTVEKGYNIESLARRMSGFVGADIENIINEAALKVARDNRKELSDRDFEYGFEKILMGPEKKIKTLKEQERKIVTYHELGHAIVSYVLPNGDPVEKISIVSRGMALGVTRFSPIEDTYLRSKAKFLDDMAGLLGGRVAEEVFFGKENITTGASNDFEKVTKMAYDMVTKYGMMEEIGTLNLTSEEYAVVKPYSEKTAEKIDELVKHLVDDQYQNAKTIIKKHQDSIQILADVLYKKEYLTKDEFEELMNAGDQLSNVAERMIQEFEQSQK
ncbi:MAG: ATP-dependent zinc metalloprotease FtsH [Candidatus Absconditabacterales bacterium]